ncbi:MAG TPA: type IV pilin protein [Zoogloea sp.]|uniref:type IV pilin protein n=1 Tax=Zoogloea sp. TaxID=49181 RepID=UPI002C453749|nr:type IV pilin protein [Zoogloea sp.]HOB46521.1 type IV pilin protein [Zoogloea sp.]
MQMRPKIPTTTSHRQAGLTLIELMIAVVIVGILAAVGYASYSNYIVKSKRSQAEACLQEAAQFMERFYTTNLRYDLTANGDAVSLPNTACVQDMRGNYSLSVSTVSANAFVLQATPNGNQALQDTQCGTLSLSQNGTKTISGGGTVSSCW